MTSPGDTAAPSAVAGQRDQLRAAALVTAALILLGIVLGFVWAAWSPPRPPGVQLSAGTVQINESEAFAAADGRFAVIAAVVGLAAGLVLWRWRTVRGPLVALSLVVGGLAGAWSTATVGHLAGHGTNHGPPQTEIVHLPLSLHLTGLYALEALLAVLVYSVLTAFAVEDDLGRPDPERDAARRRPADLVQPQYVVQHSWAHGDGAGLAQQDELAPQDPSQGS